MSLNKLYIFLVFCFVACHSTNKTGRVEQKTKSSNEEAMPEKIDYTGKPTVVYKTKNDYRKNVPITLSDDKTKVVSYPAPTDVFYNGQLAYPSELINGYLLDNRGISVNTVFTKYTYEEYSKLKATPDLETFLKSIIDKDPFVEIYNCGNRYRFKDVVPELNNEIKNNRLKLYLRLK